MGTKNKKTRIGQIFEGSVSTAISIYNLVDTRKNRPFHIGRPGWPQGAETSRGRGTGRAAGNPEVFQVGIVRISTGKTARRL